MSFLRTFFIRYLLIVTAILLPFQPMALIAKNKDINSQEVLLAQIMKHMQGPSSHALAKAAMGKVPCFDYKNSIIGATERRELQIDELTKKLDKTETSFGSVALAQSLQPIANLQTILQRQTWAQAMLDDAELYTDVQRSLKRIKRSEKAILAYWDTTQREGAKLFARAESFYYVILQILLGEKINTNKWALEASLMLKMAKVAWDVLYYFGGQELGWDLLESQFHNVKFNPYQSVKDGLKAPIMFLWPFETEVTKKIKEGKVNSMRAARGGASLGDLHSMILSGLNSKMEIEFGRPGMAIGWAGRQVKRVGNKLGQLTTDFVTTPLSNAGQFVSDRYVPDVVKQGANLAKDYIPGIPGIPTSIKDGIGYFDRDGVWTSESHAINPDELTGFAWYRNQAAAAAVALTVTGYKAGTYFYGMQNTYYSTKNIIKTMKELHLHTIHLARAINTIKAVAKRLEKHPVFGSSCMVTHINRVITNASDELKQLFELLENNTFSTTKARTHIFSRGNVFLAHRLMTNVHEEIVPLLQGLGELDALYAMVTNMKESAKTKLPYSFAEFVPHAHAMIDIKEGWLPLVRNAVPNTIVFGGEKPNKIIITGPNGGGKSVLLKLIGAIVTMALSWGIVPAEHVRMTLLNGLRSCIHPEESLEHELSTFMAEKMRVDAIKDFVFTHHHDPHFKAMLLLDEPFRGTVDAESADRIYDFGKEIASLQQVIALMATHVEKPIRLAQDTNGLFANYHVRIKELQNGQFEREFKLEPGILGWWFTDAQKRSRFIDFVTIEKHKEQIAQMMALKQAATAA